MTTEQVDQHVRFQNLHQLASVSGLCLLPKLASEFRTVADVGAVRPRADYAVSLERRQPSVLRDCLVHV
jgi:hypothetical protein